MMAPASAAISLHCQHQHANSTAYLSQVPKTQTIKQSTTSNNERNHTIKQTTHTNKTHNLTNDQAIKPTTNKYNNSTNKQ
jgi:hypothetical protein